MEALPVLQGVPAGPGISPAGALLGVPVFPEPDMVAFYGQVDAAWGELTRADPFLLELEALSTWQPGTVVKPYPSGACDWKSVHAPLKGVGAAWAGISADGPGLLPNQPGFASAGIESGLLSAQEGQESACVSEELAHNPWPNLGYLVPAPPQDVAAPPSGELLWPADHVIERRDWIMMVEQLAVQLQALEVDAVTTFLNKIFKMLPPSIMGAPSCTPQQQERRARLWLVWCPRPSPNAGPVRGSPRRRWA